MPDPAPPVVINTPTLGFPIRLGELYDVRSGKFLGVQLYPENKVKSVETNINHTELTVSLSTTHKQKATLLDVNAQLSLEVLGGLIKVTGSASYLNDEKSNTNEYAYALALKMRLNEKRILFAEPELGRNVLDIALKDYIDKGLATHFISSIVYGGNYIVNLVARQTEMTKEEKIEGKLQASFDQLKGVISLDGSVDAEVKGQFKDMDGKFDLVVHGDVALDKVPVTPKDVIDTFPEAASLVTKGGGVPISATLQPIPPDLYKAGLIFQIADDIVDTVLAAFANLDDLRSRFLVLQDSVKRLQDFVPELARTARIVSTAYIQEHSKLLHELGQFLQQHKQGSAPKHDDLLCRVNRLYNTHLELGDGGKKCDGEPKPKDEPVSTQYPSTLVGLEEELSRFQYFIADIRIVRRSLIPKTDKGDNAVDHSFYLSSLVDVYRATSTQSEIPLFVMTPISGVKNYDPVRKYLAMVKKYSEKFEDLTNTAYMFYAENLQNLEDSLPNGGKFSSLTNPSFYLGEVDEDGNLSWKLPPPPPPNPSQTYALTHKPLEGKTGSLLLALRDVNGKRSYTILFWVEKASEGSHVGSKILVFRNSTGERGHLVFYEGSGKMDPSSKIVPLQIKVDGKKYMVAFVQDVEAKKWILYLDGEEIGRDEYDEANLFESLEANYSEDRFWWNGSVHGFWACPQALSKDQIKKLHVK